MIAAPVSSWRGSKLPRNGRDTRPPPHRRLMGAARLRRVVRRATRIRYDPTTLTEALALSRIRIRIPVASC